MAHAVPRPLAAELLGDRRLPWRDHPDVNVTRGHRPRIAGGLRVTGVSARRTGGAFGLAAGFVVACCVTAGAAVDTAAAGPAGVGWLPPDVAAPITPRTTNRPMTLPIAVSTLWRAGQDFRPRRPGGMLPGRLVRLRRVRLLAVRLLGGGYCGCP